MNCVWLSVISEPSQWQLNQEVDISKKQLGHRKAHCAVCKAILGLDIRRIVFKPFIFCRESPKRSCDGKLTNEKGTRTKDVVALSKKIS